MNKYVDCCETFSAMSYSLYLLMLMCHCAINWCDKQHLTLYVQDQWLTHRGVPPVVDDVVNTGRRM